MASAEGYRNLCRLITRMKMRAPKGEGALVLDELEGFTSGLIAIGGRALLDTRHYGIGGLLDRLVGLFGRTQVVVELQRHLCRDEEADNEALTALAQAFRVPVIATNGVRFAAPADRPLFDVLTCVHHHTTLDAAGRRLARNAERYLKSPEVMAQLFADRPDALAGTAALAERLEYTMADLGTGFPAIRCRRDRPRCRSCGTSPRWGRTTAIARITTRREPRSHASWRSSRSSSLPATS